MTTKEFEQKCFFLSQTPQTRWFDLRFKAFATMMNNARIGALDISYVFPMAKLKNIGGYVYKIESNYYFLLFYKVGITYEFFNVETMDFDVRFDHVASSNVLLSSDDSSTVYTLLPPLMANGMTRSQLKSKLDNIFARV